MPKQILLVEDSVTMQKVVEITFAHEDYRVSVARDMDEALTKLRELRPDVLVADAGLPGRSGYDLCAAVKSEPSTRDIPCLLLTGNFNPYDEVRGQRSGVDAHVVKPFETQVLIDKVSDLLRRKGSGLMPASGISTTLVSMPPLPGPPPGAPEPTRRPTIPPVAPSRAPATTAAPAPVSPAGARPAQTTQEQRSTLLGITAVNPLAPGLRPPPPPGMRVRETGNLPAIRDTGNLPAVNPPSQQSPPGAPVPSGAAPSISSWGPSRASEVRTLDMGPARTGTQTGIPQNAPQMPRVPLLPRAPLPAPVSAVLERIATRGAEYEAIAKLSIETIEQIAWEVIPELAEVVFKAELERYLREREK